MAYRTKHSMTDYQEVRQTMTPRTNIRVKTTTSIEEQETVKVDPSTSPRTQCTQCQPESVRHRAMQTYMKTHAEVTRQNLQLKVQGCSSLCSAH